MRGKLLAVLGVGMSEGRVYGGEHDSGTGGRKCAGCLFRNEGIHDVTLLGEPAIRAGSIGTCINGLSQ